MQKMNSSTFWPAMVDSTIATPGYQTPTPPSSESEVGCGSVKSSTMVKMAAQAASRCKRSTVAVRGRPWPSALASTSNNERLVPYRPALSYFALSYVLGHVETSKTEHSTLAKLQQTGSLLGPRSVDDLPLTVKDAMFLTGFLGRRYLWCDRLCIVQDDKASKTSQLQQMAEIYARVYCTIIALDNSSELRSPWYTQSYATVYSTSIGGLRGREGAVAVESLDLQEELFSVRIIQLSSVRSAGSATQPLAGAILLMVQAIPTIDADG